MKKSSSRKMRLPLQRKFPPKLSHNELRDKAYEDILTHGIQNHYQSKFNAEIAKLVTEADNPAFFSIKPAPKACHRTKSWIIALEFCLNYLQNYSLNDTESTVHLELSMVGEPKSTGFFSQKDREEYLNKIIANATKRKKPIEDRLAEFRKQQALAPPPELSLDPISNSPKSKTSSAASNSAEIEVKERNLNVLFDKDNNSSQSSQSQKSISPKPDISGEVFESSSDSKSDYDLDDTNQPHVESISDIEIDDANQSLPHSQESVKTGSEISTKSNKSENGSDISSRSHKSYRHEYSVSTKSHDSSILNPETSTKSNQYTHPESPPSGSHGTSSMESDESSKTSKSSKSQTSHRSKRSANQSNTLESATGSEEKQNQNNNKSSTNYSANFSESSATSLKRLTRDSGVENSSSNKSARSKSSNHSTKSVNENDSDKDGYDYSSEGEEESQILEEKTTSSSKHVSKSLIESEQNYEYSYSEQEPTQKIIPGNAELELESIHTTKTSARNSIELESKHSDVSYSEIETKPTTSLKSSTNSKPVGASEIESDYEEDYYYSDEVQQPQPKALPQMMAGDSMIESKEYSTFTTKESYNENIGSPFKESAKPQSSDAIDGDSDIEAEFSHQIKTSSKQTNSTAHSIPTSQKKDGPSYSDDFSYSDEEFIPQKNNESESYYYSESDGPIQQKVLNQSYDYYSDYD